MSNGSIPAALAYDPWRWRAARIMSLGNAGEVLVSGTTYDLLAGSGLSFDDCGLVELKGLTGPRAIFALRTAAEGNGVSGR